MFLMIREAARSTAARLAAVLLLVLCASGVATATDPPAFELLDTGVDLVTIIPVVVGGMGAIILVVLASKFSFLLLRKGIAWLYRAFG